MCYIELNKSNNHLKLKMELHTLKPASGSVKDRKRIGRGGSRGGTSGRGTKGAQSRSGYSSKLGFEGGQMPLQRRIPKVGFKSLNKREFRPVNLGVIQKVFGTQISEITAEMLIKKGLVGNNERYKILGDGEFNLKIVISANAFSMTSRSIIEKLGGQVILIK